MDIQRISQQTISSKHVGLLAQSTPHLKGDSVGFTGNIESEFLRSVPKNSQKLLKFLKGFQEKFQGEAGGILITAVGTGLVAPFFIGFNPFVRAPKDASKEEKEEVRNTKLYTAMRQPISAVLAILFQLSVLKLIDKKFIDPIFNNPQYAKNLDINKDQSALNGKSYLESLVKKEMAAEGIVKPKDRAGKKAYSKQVAERIEAKANQQIDDLAKKFEESGIIKIGERNLPNETVADLVNKQIDQYISDAKKLRIDANGLEKYPKRAQCLVENEAHIRDIFKNIPIAQINQTTDPKELENLYQQTETILKDLLQKETNPDVKVLLKEMLDKSPDLRASRIDRTLTRINSVKEKCGGEFSVGKYYEYLCERNKQLDGLINKLKSSKIHLGKNVEVSTEAIQQAINKIAETCTLKDSNGLLKSTLSNTKTFDSNTEKLISKIYKDVTKGYKKMLENSCKSSNQVIKIIIGVCVTLQITCSALNWVYPRFMELFFPKLAGGKKAQDAQKAGGDK